MLVGQRVPHRLLACFEETTASDPGQGFRGRPFRPHAAVQIEVDRAPTAVKVLKQVVPKAIATDLQPPQPTPVSDGEWQAALGRAAALVDWRQQFPPTVFGQAYDDMARDLGNQMQHVCTAAELVVAGAAGVPVDQQPAHAGRTSPPKFAMRPLLPKERRLGAADCLAALWADIASKLDRLLAMRQWAGEGPSAWRASEARLLAAIMAAIGRWKPKHGQSDLMEALSPLAWRYHLAQATDKPRDWLEGICAQAKKGPTQRPHLQPEPRPVSGNSGAAKKRWALRVVCIVS